MSRHPRRARRSIRTRATKRSRSLPPASTSARRSRVRQTPRPTPDSPAVILLAAVGHQRSRRRHRRVCRRWRTGRSLCRGRHTGGPLRQARLRPERRPLRVGHAQRLRGRRARRRAVARRNDKDVDPKRIAVVGHGEGAWVALLAASREKRIAAVVSLAGRLDNRRRAGPRAAAARSSSGLKLPAEERDKSVALQKQINAAVLTGKGWDSVPPQVAQAGRHALVPEPAHVRSRKGPRRRAAADALRARRARPSGAGRARRTPGRISLVRKASRNRSSSSSCAASITCSCRPSPARSASTARFDDRNVSKDVTMAVDRLADEDVRRDPLRTGAVMSPSRIRVPDLNEKKPRGEKIAMLTAYDATMARLLDRPASTCCSSATRWAWSCSATRTRSPVTLDDMLHHTRAVARGAARALVVADMPFLTYQVSVEEAVRNAGRLLQEGGAAAVKLEGGRPVLDAVRRMVDVGIPVMGHLGLQPQSVHQVGGYRQAGHATAGRRRAGRRRARARGAGAFAIVLESIPAEVAQGDDRRARHPDDRHRRRTGLRRPGAREPRHARPVRRLRSVVRQAVRAPGGDSRGAATGPTSTTSATGRFPQSLLERLPDVPDR